ncbi:MAG: ATP-binding cassette domain-containing protein [Planctomycetes bacterium]|nr:ATP-binding cassette domain-containing protein [Planctomycetota bacterium]
MVDDPVLHVEGLALRRGRREVLRGLDLELGPGQAGLVIGANGSGKTSLAMALTGLLRPASGSLRRPARTGYAPQEPRFPQRASALRYLAELAALGGAGPAALSAAESALTAFGLLDQARRPVGELSRGWRQRLNLARAWLGSPSLLVLDEPQTALDPEGLAQLARLLEGPECPATLILSPAGTGCEGLAPEICRLEAPAA